MPDMINNSEKVVSLFQFIKELNKIKTKSITNINDNIWSLSVSSLDIESEYISLQFRDRIDEEEYEENEDGNILLSIKKPSFYPCPAPNALILDWLVEGWDNYRNSEVTVLEKKPLVDDNFNTDIGNVSENEAIDQYERFEDDENRVRLYGEWVALRNEWAEKELKTAKIYRVFSDLYRLYFELQRESETEEIIVANGFLCDKKDFTICHPVLTHRVNLEYDSDRDIVSITDTATPSELYTAIFRAMNDINLNSINEINQDLQKNDYHPLDRNTTPDFLKALVHQLSADSLFSANGRPQSYKERILLYCDPCFIVRKRLDGTIKAIEQIIENVQETGEIPAPIIDIVSGGKCKVPDDTGEETIEERLASVGGESIDVLLSKEANKEQLEIAKRIEFYNAVLVQGPPGTGKTHTIANLLGHFLAQGKSVLVTSYTSKALSVLKEKVADGLQNLCVSVLDDSNVDMERSIDGITTYMAKTTSHELKREMESLSIEREDIIKKLADVRRKIYSIINQECNCIVFNGKEISPSKAAKFIVENEEKLSYIPGNVKKNTLLPLSFEDLITLYKSNEELSLENEDELSNDLPDPSLLILPDAYAKVHEELVLSDSCLKEIEKENNWTVFNNIPEQLISISCDKFNITFPYPKENDVKTLKVFSASFGKIESWMKAAAVDGKNGVAFRNRWETLCNQISKVNEFKEKVVTEQFGVSVVFKDQNKDILIQPLEEIKKLYSEGKKINKLTLLLHKEYSKVLENVSINGHSIQNSDECVVVLNQIEYEKQFDLCAEYWNKLLPAHGVPAFKDLDSDNQELIALKWIPIIKTYLDWYNDNYNPLLEMLSEIGIEFDSICKPNPLDSDLTATDRVLSTVEKIIPLICDVCSYVMQSNNSNKIISENKQILLSGKRGQSKICAELYQAICDENVMQYASVYVSLGKMFEKYSLQRKRTELLSTLAIVAPDWAEAIKKHQGIHGQSSVPSDIEEAWEWKQYSEILNDMLKQPFAALQKDSISLSKEYRKITANYAEKSGWYHLLKRTEADIDMKMALQGWRLTVKKIGKGTGKQAPALKAKARKLMTKCQNAVPAWIMPINRALETLDPKNNRFDVIIIDEASQADISSLAILYMGKKLIIVGDDKQVSPMAVGVEVDKIAALEEMYIKDKIPNSHLYNPKTSIYDIATTVFKPLMLREHFRCMPEIIGFSNMLSYDNEIKPLRDSSNNKLLPSVVCYRVQNGERSGHRKTNEIEANAIVSLMKSCFEQPEYAEKSFGVISLLGDEQAKLIQQIIEREIPSKEIIGRRILCGNSANFQGDERDVVFLSVVDSGDGTGPIHLQSYGPDDSYRKRYNVAASRAKDQLWVVHSLDSANDLKPGDIRKTLIDYAKDPYATEITHQRIEHDAESPFEAEVAKSLSDRGYHLEQQRKVGAYRLDIVAVCGEKTVAIECDSERWHSGESKIREDMERQTILERLGWRFIRIRGSEYYRNSKATINRVVKELSSLGIEPENVDEIVHENSDGELLTRVKLRASQILEEQSTTKSDNRNGTISFALNAKTSTRLKKSFHQ